MMTMTRLLLLPLLLDRRLLLPLLLLDRLSLLPPLRHWESAAASRPSPVQRSKCH